MCVCGLAVLMYSDGDAASSQAPAPVLGDVLVLAGAVLYAGTNVLQVGLRLPYHRGPAGVQGFKKGSALNGPPFRLLMQRALARWDRLCGEASTAALVGRGGRLLAME